MENIRESYKKIIEFKEYLENFRRTMCIKYSSAGNLSIEMHKFALMVFNSIEEIMFKLDEIAKELAIENKCKKEYSEYLKASNQYIYGYNNLDLMELDMYDEKFEMITPDFCLEDEGKEEGDELNESND